MKKKILLIGNTTNSTNTSDGQTVKVSLYKKLIEEEGFDVIFVDLKNIKKRLIETFYQIKKNIKKCDRIVLLTASRGSYILIRYINFCNKKWNKDFVFPMIGINILHKYVDKLTVDEKCNFINKLNFNGVKPRKSDINILSKISLILPENKVVADAVKSFFHLNNVEILENFRDYQPNCLNKKNDDLRFCYVSRVCKEKGILDLLDVINNINDHNIKLDIYGGMELNDEELIKFNAYLNNNVVYKGCVSPDNIIHIIHEYSLLIFPTKFYIEGTPGIIAESFIAGTPILSSNFAQAEKLMSNGIDSIIYNFNSKDDLTDKLLVIMNDKNLITKLTKNAKISGDKFLYKNNRDKFIKYICGGSNNE